MRVEGMRVERGGLTDKEAGGRLTDEKAGGGVEMGGTEDEKLTVEEDEAASLAPALPKGEG